MTDEKAIEIIDNKVVRKIEDPEQLDAIIMAIKALKRHAESEDKE